VESNKHSISFLRVYLERNISTRPQAVGHAVHAAALPAFAEFLYL